MLTDSSELKLNLMKYINQDNYKIDEKKVEESTLGYF